MSAPNGRRDAGAWSEESACWSTARSCTATYTPPVPRPAIAALIGLAAGVVSGLFGVGGGVIVVPALVLLLGFAQRRASGTSTATIVASSAAALLAFVLEGEVDWGAAALVFAGAGIGGWTGARYLGKVPERGLSLAFAAVMMLAAARLALA